MQFKTFPMAHDRGLERDNLILGNRIYVLQNPTGPSVRLATLICSDSLDLQDAHLLTPILDRCLIVHLQLNPNPRNPEFKRYRDHCFSAAEKSVEIICLNWAKGLTFNPGNVRPDQTIHGTAYYSRAEKLDRSAERINSNHRKGLYITSNSSNHSYGFFFNSSPMVFNVRSTKPWQGLGIAVTCRRTGPEVVSTYTWNDQTESWGEATYPLDDGSRPEFQQHDGLLPIHQRFSADPFNLERLVNLSCGKIKLDPWHLVENLRSFKTDATEVVHRITCTLDSSEPAIETRRNFLSQFSALNFLLSSSNPLPIAIRNITDPQISFDPQKPFRNLFSNDGTKEATVIYMGENRSQEELDEIFTRITDVLYRAKADQYLVVIWYRSNGLPKVHKENVRPTIDDPSESPLSITGTKSK